MALKEGFKDAGIGFISNFPGFFSHKLFEELGGKTISLNERVAYAEAFGASLGGLRSVATFKNVGLSIASDAYLHSLLSGVNAGLVMVVTDDTEVWGSQERQDSRPFLDFHGGLWFEPTSIQQAYDFAYKSFEISEKFDIPVGIRLTNQFFKLEGEFIKKEKVELKKDPLKDPSKNVVHPIYWQKQLKALEKKKEGIQNYANSLYEALITNKENGIVVFGNCRNELSNYDLSKYDILTINTYPLPLELIEDFVKDKKEIVILEQGIDYAHRIITSYLNKDARIISNTGFVPDLSSTYVKWERYEKFFKALKKVNPSFTVGDVTQFTVDTTDSIDACLSLGVAVSTTIGVCQNEKINYPFCIVGDCSILHEGLDIINEALKRDAKFGIIVFDNGGSWCTGGQDCTTSIYDLNPHIKVAGTVNFNETSTESFENILQGMRGSNELQILFIRTEMGELRIKS